MSKTTENVIICKNTEVLRGIWEDLYEEADLPIDLDEDALTHEWSARFSGRLIDAGFDFEYDGNFANWNGGPYSGRYHYEGGQDDLVYELSEGADTDARNLAKRLIAEHLEANEA